MLRPHGQHHNIASRNQRRAVVGDHDIGPGFKPFAFARTVGKPEVTLRDMPGAEQAFCNCAAQPAGSADDAEFHGLLHLKYVAAEPAVDAGFFGPIGVVVEIASAGKVPD